MFQVPFTAGWSFGRRLNFEMNKGDAEEAERYLKVELLTSTRSSTDKRGNWKLRKRRSTN